MSTASITEYRSGLQGAPDRFSSVLRAEWTKFRTVRGWVIGILIAALVTAGIALLDHSECGGPNGAACTSPVGPAGEAVTDSFYFVHQPLAVNGSITARMTALTAMAAGQSGLAPWTKAGIIIKASTRPGSAYAAMMLTGSHGVRMQYDYTADIAGMPGRVSAASPRWLRLTRSGDTVTGYDSADGTAWTVVGTAHLTGLPATVQAGMFATSPGTTVPGSRSLTGSSSGGALSLATGVFDHVSLRGGQAAGAWTGSGIGGGGAGFAGPGTSAGYHQAGGSLTVTGTGDIAPVVAGNGDGTPVEQLLTGVFGGLIAVIVVAAMFMTAEYRRGLIRVTLAASPRRGRVLAAKAVVIGSVSFLAGLAGAVVALAAGEPLLRSNGNYILPVSTLTDVRVMAGTAALVAVTAILAVALGALLRSSAAAITIAITVVVLPYLLGQTVLPAGAADWVLRITPAAAFAIQQTTPQYPQVTASYTPAQGYFPLAPWAGFAVLCAYAALALGLAVVILRRRDA
ncbi:MAG TPA: ABC transporter permease subunit [Streptosporangiaceae bacterium]|jgi:ABC-type transport system involved in multi-copper enzyme maturation permease subunit|nr:ABC transporter permease subunit [Streptosporangiaceae bacterium]